MEPEVAIAELRERVHYAEGTAELAMKHRDEAEAQRDRLKAALEGVMRTQERWGLTKARMDAYNEACEVLRSVTTPIHLGKVRT